MTEHDGGEVVLRRSGPWTPAVLALLIHFERVGFTGAPRVIGTGVAADGRERVEFIPGTNPHPKPWPEEAFAAIGALLRRAHEAAITFAIPPDAHWQPWFGRDLPGNRPVIGHCDAAPWNIIHAADGRYVLIDWEYAGPVDAVSDLAYTAWLNAQLHDDDIAELHALPPAAARATQVEHLLDGYGLPRGDRNGFVDRMIELAVHAARADAVEYQVTPDSSEAIAADSYPILWGITWRVRAASWMLRNRSLLQRTVER